MKYIITETKMKSVVTKWLDKKYSNLEKYVSPGSVRYIHYKNENSKTVFLFNRNTGLLTISDNTLHQELKHMFSINRYELNDIFIPWLEQVYNLHVERVQYSDFDY